MITIRAGNGAIGICLLLLLTGCSREQQDWRSAEAADTIAGYSQFIQRHPESELVTQARTRVVQLGEDRDWQRAGSADTVDAYRAFLAEHPNGKWAQEARIRIENFSLGEQAGTDAGSRVAAGRAGGGAGAGGAGGARTAAGAGGAAGAATARGAAGESSVAAAGGTAGTGADARAGANAGGGGGRSSGLASSGEAAMPMPRPASAAGGAVPNGGASGAAGGAMSGGAAPGASGAGGGAAGGGAAGGGAAGGGGFGIQLGAFSSEAGASNEWRALVARFGEELKGLHEHVVAADTAAGRVYRLQAVVGDEARARAICDSLRKRSQGCVAVLPH